MSVIDQLLEFIADPHPRSKLQIVYHMIDCGENRENIVGDYISHNDDVLNLRVPAPHHGRTTELFLAIDKICYISVIDAGR